MYNYILECLGGLGGYKFNGPPNKLTYISPTTWIFWVGNTLLEPEVNDSLKILWGFICVLGQQLDDLFYPLLLSLNLHLWREKYKTKNRSCFEVGIEEILFYFLWGFFLKSSFKLVFLPFISLDYFTDEKWETERG